MRLVAAIQGNLTEMLQAEMRGAARAVTAGIRAATDGLKTELRSQVTGAGLGSRLANTWRGEIYPKGQPSIGAAGYVWSKAPEIVRAHWHGAVIRARRSRFLAIPLPAAGSGNLLTPESWERRTGQKLRFVYRGSRPSLLVLDNARLTKRGRARANLGRSKGVAYSRLAGRTTVPIFVLVPQVTLRPRLDVNAPAEKWISALPALVMREWRD